MQDECNINNINSFKDNQVKEVLLTVWEKALHTS